MDHQALLRAIETSDCNFFIEWYEKAQSQVTKRFNVIRKMTLNPTKLIYFIMDIYFNASRTTWLLKNPLID